MIEIYAIEAGEYDVSRVDLSIDGVQFLNEKRSDSDGIYMEDSWEVSNNLIDLKIKRDGKVSGYFIDEENDNIPARITGNCKIQR